MPVSPPSNPFDLPPGTRQVRLRGELPPGDKATVAVEAGGEAGEWKTVGLVEFSGPPPRGLRASLLSNWDARLLWLALTLYLAVRLVALPDFPIYFFSDEALQTVLAADLVRDGMRGYSKELFPTYFPNAGQYNLGVSVYAQVLPYLLFDKSVWVTRGTPALLSLLAALSTGLALREAFGLRRAWLGVLVLSAVPVWFLHTRTAFETALAVSFYACFLCAYLLYRQGRVRWIYAAVAAAALSFYSYSPAQIVVCVTALLLFFSDLRYHWRQRFALLPALGLALLLAGPYLRHQVLHPGAILQHLAILDSYWTAPISLNEKLAKAAAIYLRGLDPVYWFLPQTVDLPRHSMDGWGHLLRWTFPFTLGGLGVALWNWRRSEYRALLLALLACPLGAVPVGLGVTRVLFLVIPAAMLTALGFNALIELLGRLRAWLRPTASALSLLVLALASPVLMLSALEEGPFWYRDYGLGGMQYGAVQVFSAIRAELDEHPERPIVLSPTWANGTDSLARFFFAEPLPFVLKSIRSYAETYTPFAADTLFILPATEYPTIPNDMFSLVEIERTLLFPDGSPGFYFLRLGYAPDAEQILANRRQERAAQVEEPLVIAGAEVRIRHTRLDIGEIRHAFDGDADTLIRTELANPLAIELAFPQPVALSGVTARVGGPATTLRVRASAAGESEPRAFELVLAESEFPRDAAIDFGTVLRIETLDIEVLNTQDPPEAHVHLWEIWLTPTP
jgi:4-amino-4-deoxy-L-arabinose transferase-like glycosyltransferase